MRPSPKLLSVFMLVAPFSLVSAQQSLHSPPDLRIATAQKKVKASPDAQSYNDLAFAFLRKGRDLCDTASYNAAEAALKRSLEIAPGNYEARKFLAVVYFGRQQYAETLKLATELNTKVPDDIANWGLLVDVNMALGKYAEAERDAQWVLDLRAGSALGFEKAAALREVFGDSAGSIEFYDEANRRTSPNDADQHAWYLTRKADLELSSGNVRAAEDVINQALLLFPDSQLALATLAQIRAAQSQYDQAASLLERRYEKVNTPRNLYAWAEALEKSSHRDRAPALFRQFETEAQVDSGQAGLELIFFYLSQKNNAVKALALATARSAKLQDCDTLDVLAWALYSNGKYSEARTQLDRALAVGVRNPVYFCHAAQIAARLNDASALLKFRKEVADLRPNVCPAEMAVATIGGMGR